MNAVIILFAIGLIFLAFEVIVPGAVLGILGGISLLAGCAVAFAKNGVVGGLSVTGVALALVGLMLYFEFVLLPKTSWGKRLFLKTAISGTSQLVTSEETKLVGETAEAATTLAPSGYVTIKGRRYEAFSQSGHVPAGTQLRVVAVDNFRIIVSKT